MPRLFTGLEIPREVTARLALLQSGLPGARWIGQEDFHLTIRFLGDVERPAATAFAEMLQLISLPAITIELDRLDVFGRGKPHTLFAGVQRNESLDRLRDAQEVICRQLNMPPDARKFTPHVTIARTRGVPAATIAAYLASTGDFRSQPFTVNRFVLFSSKGSVGGGPYVREATYQLSE